MMINSLVVNAKGVLEHPCFNKNASTRYGRIHLPVAVHCNIECNYCDRRYDCVNESRPGVTSRVIVAEEAVSRVAAVIKLCPEVKVAAVAGPGEPLFNEETFNTFRLIDRAYPDLYKCVSTNGLLLPDKVGELKELGLNTLTVTVNAVDPVVAAQIYSFVNYKGRRTEGCEAASLLLHNQILGIQMAIEADITVKVNTVLIPGINDEHIIEVAGTVGKLGVYIQNIIPLIPLSRFSHLPKPSIEEKKELQKKCSEYVTQMTHCRYCRADAAGLLGKDISAETLEAVEK